jgi:hypothetical protein
MARGHPDFGATAPRELTTPQLDSGELAARLGSPNVYDRLGTVLALYTADQPVAPIFEVNAGSGRRDSVVVNTPFSAYAWRLTAAADGEEPGVRFLVPYIGDSPVAVEVVFRQVDAGSINPTLTILVDNATDRTQAGVRWNADNSTWEFLNSAGVFTATPTQASPVATTLWATLKFTVDPIEQTYGRARFNGVDMGLAGTAADDLAGFLRTLEVDFTAEGNAAATVSIDVAAVIITVNEV